MQKVQYLTCNSFYAILSLIMSQNIYQPSSWNHIISNSQIFMAGILMTQLSQNITPVVPMYAYIDTI